MGNVSFETLFAVAVLLLGLRELVVRRLGERPRKVRPRDRGEDISVVEEDEPPLKSAQAAARDKVVPPRLPSRSPAAAKVSRAPHPAGRRMNPAVARRGVVLMAVLGPCRGHAPPAEYSASRARHRNEGMRSAEV